MLVHCVGLFSAEHLVFVDKIGVPSKGDNSMVCMRYVVSSDKTTEF